MMIKTGKSLGLDLREDIIIFAQNNLKNIEKVTGLDLSNVTFEVRNCFLPGLKDEKYGTSLQSHRLIVKIDRIHSGACCPEAKTQELLNLLAPGGILVVFQILFLEP